MGGANEPGLADPKSVQSLGLFSVVVFIGTRIRPYRDIANCVIVIP